MVLLNVTETDRAPVTTNLNLSEEFTVVVGETGATAGSVPAVNVPTRLRSREDATVYGAYTDGSLPATLEAIYDEYPNADVVAIRHDGGSTVSAVSALTNTARTVERLFGKRVTLVVVGDDTWNVGAGGNIDNSTPNALVTAVEQICGHLGCLGVVSGPNGTVAETVAWSNRNVETRVIKAWPRVKLAGETAWTNPAGSVAGALMATRVRRGYWRNPNNSPVVGVAEVEYEVYYNPRDPNSDSNQLQRSNVVTILDARNTGFRLFGTNLGVSPAESSEKAEIKIRTILDRLEVFAERVAFDFADEDTTSITIDAYLARLTTEVNRLRSINALRHGAAYLDPTVPLSMQIATGEVHLVLEANGVRSLKTINLNIVS